MKSWFVARFESWRIRRRSSSCWVCPAPLTARPHTSWRNPQRRPSWSRRPRTNDPRVLPTADKTEVTFSQCLYSLSFLVCLSLLVSVSHAFPPFLSHLYVRYKLNYLVFFSVLLCGGVFCRREGRGALGWISNEIKLKCGIVAGFEIKFSLYYCFLFYSIGKS